MQKNKKNNLKSVQKKTKRKIPWLKIIVTVILFDILAIGSVFLYNRWVQAQDLAEEYTFAYNEVAKIGNEKITIEEFMLYSVDTTASYESTYGEDIWSEITLNNNGEQETYETLVKKEILEQIRMVKAFCKEADALEISITDEELEMLKESSDAYYESLAMSGATENEDLTREVVYDFYKENYLAQKVHAYYAELYPVEEGSDKSYSEEFLEKTAEITEKYYPDFKYDYDINWELLDYLDFDYDSRSESAENVESNLDSESTVFKEKEDSKGDIIHE